MDTSIDIVQLANKRFNRVIEWRRWFHEHPELSGEERFTAEKIGSILDELHIPYKTGIGGYGIMALIEGNSQKPCILLRADMDALPISEETGLPFASKHEGKMHACGHDLHMANLLGVASMLNELKDNMRGCVKLIFQPSEETLPGGALPMIEAGVLDNPQVDVALGLHVIPDLAYDEIGLRAGAFMAATDEWYLTLKGKSGHAAQPHKALDALGAAAQIILAYHSLKHRSVDPLEPAVITVGHIRSNGRVNVIADEVHVEGTFRCFNEEIRTHIREEMKSIAEYISSAYNVQAYLKQVPGYPVLVNDATLVNHAFSAWHAYSEHFSVKEIPPRLTAEDFAYFTQRVPSLFYRLGVSPKDRSSGQLHTPVFNPDEKSLLTGMMSMVSLTLSLMQNI